MSRSRNTIRNKKGKTGIKYTLHNYESRFNILNNQNNICSICGKSLNIDNFTIDHYIPRSKEGSSEQRNLFITCKECNKQKSNKIYKPEEIYKYTNEEKLEEAKKEYSLWAQYNSKIIQKRTKIILVYIKDTLIEIPFDRNLYTYDNSYLRIVRRLENVYNVSNIDLVEEPINIRLTNIEINEPLYITDIDTSVLLVTDRSKMEEAKQTLLYHHRESRQRSIEDDIHSNSEN